jgi:2-polyprenyl-6-methoxyphenol hydroxylase-like FAD-dependent oxidoreductase
VKLGRVLVVGAGIGGLTAASALRAAGADVVVIERAPVFAPLGAGIVLAANAVRALRSLGIDPTPHGTELAAFEVRTAAGDVLSAVRTDEVSPGQPAIGVHRAALHEVLLSAIRTGAEVRLGRTVARLEDRGDQVEVELDDGSVDRFDLVSGADGLHSAIRAALGGPAPVYSGYTCWRAVVDDDGGPIAREWWGRGRRFGAVPLPAGRTYLFLTRNAPEGGSAAVEDFRSMCADFEPLVRELVDRIEPRSVLHHDLSALTGSFWGRGRVWLLGDAAHATLPNEGQGAAMAIEDAVALRVSASEPDAAAAFARYVRLRDARVRKIQRDSRALGWVGQWENAALVGLRDRLMRAVPHRLAAGQLRAVVQPGLDLAAAV